ncbi:MAG: hypothetical protein WC643_00080 [Parcubacteria group bacterium]
MLFFWDVFWAKNLPNLQLYAGVVLISSFSKIIGISLILIKIFGAST